MTNITRRTILKATGATLALPVLGGIALAQDSALKIGFVLPGPKDDGGWSEAHVRGAMAMKEHFGDAVEVTFVENIFAEADSERVLRDLAQSGHKLIYLCTVSEVVYRVASSFADVMFEQCEGYKLAPNVSTYSLRFYEGHAVEGVIAGHVSKTGKIGVVTSFPVPTVMTSLNAFTIMARKVNPDIVVTPAWLSTFYDPAKESDAARAFIDQGADVVVSYNDSPAVLQIDEQKGAYGFGLGKDVSSFAPKAHLTAVVYNWAPYYIASVGALKDGTWSPADSWLGMAEGGISLAKYNESLSKEVVDAAEAAREAIVSGTLSPFDGPVSENKGNVVIAEGTRLEGTELRLAQWLAEGVAG